MQKLIIVLLMTLTFSSCASSRFWNDVALGMQMQQLYQAPAPVKQAYQPTTCVANAYGSPTTYLTCY